MLDLDAALAAIDLSRLRGLWLGVRHLPSAEASYWWLDGVFEKARPRDFGLPVQGLVRRAEFRSPAEVGRVWKWVRTKSAELRLDTPLIDEQLWFGPGAEALEDRLREAHERMPGAFLALRGSSYPDERGLPGGFELRAEFTGREGSDRPALALLAGGTEGDPRKGEVWQWAQTIAARHQVALEGSLD